MRSLKERLDDCGDIDDWGDRMLSSDTALEIVKEWLQDQYREYHKDEGSSRMPGIRWAASYLGDRTCSVCIGTGEHLTILSKPRKCVECEGKGSI